MSAAREWLASAAGAVALAVALGGGARASLSDGLVAHWSFDEQTSPFVDDSGNGHDGTPAGAPTWTSAGMYNGALLFDGVDDSLDCGSLGISGAAPRSVAGWAKADSVPGGWACVFGFVTLSDQGAGTCFDVAARDYIIYYFHVWGNDDAQVISNLDLTWHHFALTYDGTTGVAYVDGVEKYNQALTLNTNDRFKMGYQAPVNMWTVHFNGSVDEVRVYDRVLSQTEVLQLMSATATIEATDPDAAEPSDEGTFTVTCVKPAAMDLTVPYTVTGTAVADSDYVALTGTVLLPGVQTTATITVTPLDDDEWELPETVIVTLEEGAEYVVLNTPESERTVTIADDGDVSAFDLLLPDGAADVPYDQAAEFTWEAAAGATSYQFVLATDAGISSVVVDVDGIAGEAHTLDAWTLEAGVDYFWTVTAHGAIVDLEAANAPVQFHAVDDVTPPQVTSTSPGNGANLESTVSITFSEPLLETLDANAVILVRQDGVAIAGSAALTGNDRVIIFTPAEDLEYDTTYTVTVTTGVVDRAGNAMLAEYVFTFNTRDRLVGLGSGDGCAAGAAGAGWPSLVAALVALALRAVARSRTLT